MSNNYSKDNPDITDTEMVAAKRKEEDNPMFERMNSSILKFGAHVSASGGIACAVLNAAKLGCNSFAMFLKNPRRWESPPLTDEDAAKFIKNCDIHGYDPRVDVLPHGQYFINLCNPSKENSQRSYNAFVDDLKRCEKLNVGHYNLHPGSVLKNGDRDSGIKQLAKYINLAHKETNFVKIVLENMASSNVIGCRFEDLKDAIDMIDDKSRVGVCVDTCHSIAAGYDVNQFEEFWKEFDSAIGFEYLSGIHLNDSKTPLDSNRDLHQNLGLGFVSLDFFRQFATSKNNKYVDKFKKIPIILETPTNGDKFEGEHFGKEIKLLELMSRINDAEFEKLKKQLSKSGQKERESEWAKFEKKQVKRKKDGKGKSGKELGKRKIQEPEEISRFFKKSKQEI